MSSDPAWDDSTSGVRGVQRKSGQFRWFSFYFSSLSQPHRVRLQEARGSVTVRNRGQIGRATHGSKTLSRGVHQLVSRTISDQRRSVALPSALIEKLPELSFLHVTVDEGAQTEIGRITNVVHTTCCCGQN